MVSGCVFFHSPHVVSRVGKKSSWMPLSASSPITGCPSSWFQRDRVSRSYMILLLRYRNPDVPKVVSISLNLPLYAMPAPQSVQYAREIGSPPRTSFAISCGFMMRRGYARCSPLIDTPKTRS